MRYGLFVLQKLQPFLFNNFSLRIQEINMWNSVPAVETHYLAFMFSKLADKLHNESLHPTTYRSEICVHIAGVVKTNVVSFFSH